MPRVLGASVREEIRYISCLLTVQGTGEQREAGKLANYRKKEKKRKKKHIEYTRYSPYGF